MTTVKQDQALKLLSVSKLWDKADHNGFTDLIEYRGIFFLCFREGKSHSGDIENGSIRVLQSLDKEHWKVASLLQKPDVDLRDPHFSIMPDGRLMLTLGGSIYLNGKYEGCCPQVAFSSDGVHWSIVHEIFLPNEWIWRVTWAMKIGFGFSYRLSNPKKKERPWILTLFKTIDGLKFIPIKEFHFRNHPSEATLRIDENDQMVALLRRKGNAWIGNSYPPYLDWKWHNSGHYIGGGNFLILPDGRFVAGGRGFNKEIKKAKITDGVTKIGMMTLKHYFPEITLPSKGDNSYPGIVFKDGILYVSYYSSHEGKACIYLAKISVADKKRH